MRCLAKRGWSKMKNHVSNYVSIHSNSLEYSRMVYFGPYSSYFFQLLIIFKRKKKKYMQNVVTVKPLFYTVYYVLINLVLRKNKIVFEKRNNVWIIHLFITDSYTRIVYYKIPWFALQNYSMKDLNCFSFLQISECFSTYKAVCTFDVSHFHC